ncbi:bifunctional transcriptional activator/DNA repair enzyme AdaA [Paenibacillus oryzae]|uniref:bifunctional transcriptional activator/DNA repair enzyme AdaA n=1 Tax=Paenibacillus oryzae TaxID=1844972 RepID=UPI0009ED159D|nr:bifunctional transcriptional activator/DNA repair enzyme AdaA [Paenibacillus oryzae]
MQEEQWHAITQCDHSYDGKFFYAVKTTRIFCRPSCKSRVPNQINVEIFMSVDDAVHGGYRPCKRCRPDRFLCPTEELVSQITKFINENYKEHLTLSVIAENLHINMYYLHHTFKRVSGITIMEYVMKKRIEMAKQLLENSNYTITRIAVINGFSSAAHFSTTFRKWLGISPSGYRSSFYL